MAISFRFRLYLLLTICVATAIGCAATVHARSSTTAINSVRLGDSSGEVWLVTSSGLKKARVETLKKSPGDSGPLGWGPDATPWEVQEVGGRTDRPFDTVQVVAWPGRPPGVLPGEITLATSEGTIWARDENDQWVNTLSCSTPACPDKIFDLSVTYDNEQSNEDNDLIASGTSGLWLLRRDRSGDQTPQSITKMIGWKWVALDRNVTVLRAMQDQTGRIWAVIRNPAGKGPASLRVYPRPRSTDPDEDRAGDQQPVTRPLPENWDATDLRDVSMAPDSRGGMWIGLPQGVLWMNVDLSIRDQLAPADLGVASSRNDGECAAATKAGFKVISIDNALDDVLVGSSKGLNRISVGMSGPRGISSPLPIPASGPAESTCSPVVRMARNIAGGDVWVATQKQLALIPVDRWSEDRAYDDPIVTLISGSRPADPEDDTSSKVDFVLMASTKGLDIAEWDSESGTLESPPYSKLFKGKLITSLTRPRQDGSAFVATEDGLFFLEADHRNATQVEAVEGRVAEVEIIGKYLLVGTSRGSSYARVDEPSIPEAALKFEITPLHREINQQDVSDDVDVTAFWGAFDKYWVGTAGSGLFLLEEQCDAGEAEQDCKLVDAGVTDDFVCGSLPPPDAVVRTAVATGPNSFVVITSKGVYEAAELQTRSRGAPNLEQCEIHFFRRDSADSNVALAIDGFDAVAGSVRPDRRKHVAWLGADSGMYLIAWPGTFGGLSAPVVSAFPTAKFLDGWNVSALAAVDEGARRTLLIGTEHGIFYHTPSVTANRFALERARGYKLDGALAAGGCEDAESCATQTTLPAFEYETRKLEIELRSESLGGSARFQILLENEGRVLLEDNVFQLETDSGRTEAYSITGLDDHLNSMTTRLGDPEAPLSVELQVKAPTLSERYWDSMAAQVATWVFIVVTILWFGYRTLRRRGWHDLLDVEVSAETNGEVTTVVVTVGEESHTSRSLIDRSQAQLLWDKLQRNPDDTTLIPTIGKILFDGLVSVNARKIVSDASSKAREVRLRLRGLRDDLSALPWEALCTPDGRLTTRSNTCIVRDLRPPSSMGTSELASLSPLEEATRMLVVIAAPGDLDPIDGAESEVSEIEAAVKARYGFMARGKVDVLRHATPQLLKDRLNDEGYEFVHIIAHGDLSGRGPRLWLEDEDGDAVRFESDEIIDLFSAHDRKMRRTRLVVLNSCLSADAGSGEAGAAVSGLAADLVLRAEVPAVVGMSMKIHTPAAKQFTAAFYKTLFRHGQVDHAMVIARRAVSESNAEWLAPRLYIGSSKPELFGDR